MSSHLHLIEVTLLGFFFLSSQGQTVPSYRTACYRVLGSDDQTMKIFFRDWLNFLPGQFEIRFHRYEQSYDEITIFEQQHSVKVEHIGEMCDTTLDVGRFTVDQRLLRYLNITLYFGLQEHVLDKYSFMLTDRTPDGLYTLDGINDRSLIQIRVVNEKNTFNEYYYDGPFYHQELEFVLTGQYCLKLWHKFPGDKLIFMFLRAYDIKLPQLVTVNFHIANEPSINTIDLGEIYMCPGENSDNRLTIYFQPELQKEPINILLLDSHNKVRTQSHSWIGVYDYIFPIKKQSEYYFSNLKASSVPLQSLSTWDAEKGVMLFRTDFKTRKCNLGGHTCVVEEYLNGVEELYTQGVCEMSSDPNNYIFLWKRVPKSEHMYCLSKWRDSLSKLRN